MLQGCAVLTADPLMIARWLVVGQCQSSTCVRELDFQCEAHKAKAALRRSADVDCDRRGAAAAAAATLTRFLKLQWQQQQQRQQQQQQAATNISCSSTCATLREAGKQVSRCAGKCSATFEGGGRGWGGRLRFFLVFKPRACAQFAMRQHVCRRQRAWQ